MASAAAMGLTTNVGEVQMYGNKRSNAGASTAGGGTSTRRNGGKLGDTDVGSSTADAAYASTGSARLCDASGPDDDVQADDEQPDAVVHAEHATDDAAVHSSPAAASCTNAFQRVFSEPIG